MIYFLLISFGLSILISLIVMLTGGHASKYIGIGYVSMFIPAIAVVIMKLFFKAETGAVDWNKFPVKWNSLYRGYSNVSISGDQSIRVYRSRGSDRVVVGKVRQYMDHLSGSRIIEQLGAICV